MSSPRLEELLLRWMNGSPAARDAAEWLLDKAASKGELPAAATLPEDDPRTVALMDLISEGSMRRRGARRAFLIGEFEEKSGLDKGTIVQTLAEILGTEIENRRAANDAREQLVAEVLGSIDASSELARKSLEHHLKETAARRGRFWNFAGGTDGCSLTRSVASYFALLHRIDTLRQHPEDIVRAVRLGVEVSGDSHWFRPGTQVWKWAAEDVARAYPELLSPGISDRIEQDGAVLSACGIVENLTSVRVLIYGDVTLRGDGFEWDWPARAAESRLPVWLGAIHVNRARLVIQSHVEEVVSVENETSFWDLLEVVPQGTVLVYTEGQANRAVVMALRQIAASRAGLAFHHEGDLDLPGVRILNSLRERTGLDIHPRRMDSEALLKYHSRGIMLTPRELGELRREVEFQRLPCGDLLAEMLRLGIRVEQEVVTAGGGV